MTTRPGVGPHVRGQGLVVHRAGRAILDRVDIDASPGVVTAVTGASGAGKSTLLWVIAGLIEPDEGSISPDDRFDLSAVVVQSYALLPVLTAKENVELPLLMRGVTGEEAARRTEEALAQAGLPDLQDRLAEELSGGQRQRVAVARALAMRARLLVADEPTAELDATAAALVVSALRAEAEAGATVVLSTNDPALAAQCDRVYRLHDGAIQPDTSPTEPD
ncbi:MAG: ATP-binding cassette domain-containing protein [Actinomycetales bacterium]|nr:ATP-binding cassette domain-containing protein [Actinomycetales bacterium]